MKSITLLILVALFALYDANTVQTHKVELAKNCRTQVQQDKSGDYYCPETKGHSVFAQK